MLQHLATWRALSVVAFLDVVFILLQLSSPPTGVHPLFILFSGSSDHLDPHQRLLQELQVERRKVLSDMLHTAHTLRNATRTLQLSEEMLAAVDSRLQAFENALRHYSDQHP